MAPSQDGRYLPGIKWKSSPGTFWKVFRLAYERKTSNKITKQMNCQMRCTTVSTTKKKFGHGSCRPHNHRPQAILNSRYRHIQVSLLRDPEGEPHRINPEFTFEYTKEWLGAKDA
ncbi:hypothetical protein M752DRAFT_287819 [Aspergillus phoenicis ATCC 13157]|uniref:Uncharacterized protein n=1 Tax=Aspergillus phoenicis ATCC 13157 TaxID=1353007 RepID=A0A370P3P1_ASPPH|nr:hypothetical protein M752DRAFT_287819 [Aspergillus phoenicis ATCC 13157]